MGAILPRSSGSTGPLGRYSARVSHPIARSSVGKVSIVALLALAALPGSSACSSAASTKPDDDASAQGAVGSAGSSAGSAGFAGGGGFIAGGSGGTTAVVIPDPQNCAEAAEGHTYVGCDFWPTVLDNIVRPDFDFAVVAANAGAQEAEITVERGTTLIGKTTVQPGSLVKMFLPWVPELKSLTSIAKGCPTDAKLSTVNAKQGAYHVTSNRPVALYQFNAIEYEGKGGPAGKDWGTCQTDTCLGMLKGKCFSYSNDASLLLPSTALTGNYRVAGPPAWQDVDPDSTSGGFVFPPYVAVTGTVDGTLVNVKLSATAAIAKGAGLPDIPAGGTTSFKLDKGDVALLVGKQATGVDFSGTLIQSSAPVQVLSGISCSNVPADRVACDHLEESVLPAETMGKHYFVTAPSGPSGKMLGHVIRFYGNVDGTTLTYPGKNPGGPTKLDAGEVVDVSVTSTDFEVYGDQPFMVGSFQVGAGPKTSQQLGDPSQSFLVTVEQFRTKYVFLTPDDYDESYADIVQPLDAVLTLDGAPVAVTPTEISSGYGSVRVKLAPGNKGAHVLTSDKAVGLQVMGYGSYTSYQYPGGLNLGQIAPPPIK